jgi:hypothetical protein
MLNVLEPLLNIPDMDGIKKIASFEDIEDAASTILYNGCHSIGLCASRGSRTNAANARTRNSQKKKVPKTLSEVESRRVKRHTYETALYTLILFI